MKKKSLISLSSLLLASALLVGCGNKSANKQEEVDKDAPITESEDNTQEDSSQGSSISEVTKYTITINLKGVQLIESAQAKTSFLTRSGTLWSVLKKKAPTKDDILTPDKTHIGEISYTYDEAGTNKIDDQTQIHEDTPLYLQITHVEPADNYCTVKWLNDGDTPTPLYSDEKYSSGETPFYKGVTPKSEKYADQTFIGWSPEISEITDSDIGTTKTYVAQYESVGVDCKVTYDLNYEGKKDIRKVKQNTTASPLDPAPVRQHYTLKGWYEEATCEHEFVFAEHPIADDTTVIYAGWTPDIEKVTVDPNGGKFTDDTTSKKVLDVNYNTTWAEVKADTEHPIGIKEAPVGSSLDAYKYQYYDVAATIWKDIPSDDFKIESNLSIKVVYEPFVATLKFEDEYQAATMPGNKDINYGTKWVEIKNDCVPTNVKTGFTFDHYYIMSGETKTVIDDKYVFNFIPETSTITLHAVYKVNVSFSNDNTKGHIEYASAEFKTGDKWGDVKAKYLPAVIDPTVWAFKNYTTDETPSATVDDNYIIKKPLTFTANYEGATANNFASDSWDVFTSYLNGKTFEQIIAEDQPYYDEYHGAVGDKAADTFIGLTRTIDIQGKTYTVRVIDEATNDSATSQHSHLLTFEFVSTFGLALPYSLNITNNNYNASFINAYLNNDFIYGLPKALQDAIKTRPIEYYDTNAQSVKNDLNQKIFVLSASELGFNKYPDPEYGADVAKEGKVYAFYSAIDDNDRIKHNESDVAVNYWTRSADIYGSFETAWNINTNGTLGDDDGYSIMVNENNIYLAPAFEL